MLLSWGCEAMAMAVVGNVCQVTAALTRLVHLWEVSAPVNVHTRVHQVLPAATATQCIRAKA